MDNRDRFLGFGLLRILRESNGVADIVPRREYF